MLRETDEVSELLLAGSFSKAWWELHNMKNSCNNIYKYVGLQKCENLGIVATLNKYTKN
jgi:hypothetical protein